MTDLAERVKQFNTMQLPGQPMGMHMGTSTLVNDLWREVGRLRSDLALLGPVTTPLSGQDCASCGLACCADWTYCPSCGAQERVEGAISPHQRRKD